MIPPQIPQRNHEDTTGLKSISRRLTEIEKDMDKDDMNFLSRLKKIEKQNKKEALENLYNSYANSLAESNIIVDCSNFVDVIIHTIKYVNQNIANICKLAQAKQSIDFEKICIVNFILDMKINEWTEEMIKKGVDSLYLIIIYTQLSNNEVSTTDLVKSKSKKKFF